MPSFSLPPSRDRGAALIIALAIMVLVLALIVGILSRVSTERGSAGGYASAISARLLSDTAVQMVQAQIDVASSDAGNTVWSSQPGLIRTFDNTGHPAKSYKLYSSDAMQVDGALNPATEAGTLTQWYQNPALYTDLNMPVDSDHDGTPDRWPILDPSAATGTNAVQGFAINNAPTGGYQGVTNTAPMPVKWLYILQDGQVVAPTGNGSTAIIAGAGTANPITGRIAFWTDDETCKINVNTASEGAYWDIPRFSNLPDKNLGMYQPVAKEFQAYPGHPATVSLSAVFPQLSGSTPATMYDPYYTLAPRVQSGGSRNLTVLASTSTPGVVLDADRLYANEDELLFSGSRTSNAGLTSADIRRASFFLTASSRAPEVTLFGTPKVVCWPLSSTDDINHRSAFDRLIAGCGTLNGYPYYFQRANKNSSTFDYQNISRNQVVYSYLQQLMATPTPGFGGVLNTKFGNDSDQILTEIFDYLRCTNLNDLNLPAQTASTSYRYGDGIFSRGYGGNEVAPIVIGNTRGFGRVTTFSEVALWLICTADPTVTSGTIQSNTSNNLTLPSVSGSTILLTSDTAAGTKQIRVEAALMLDPFMPMQAAIPTRPDIEVLISGLESWGIQGDSDPAPVPLGFPSQSRQTYSDAGILQLGMTPENVDTMYNWGGNMGVDWTFARRGVRARNGTRLPADGVFAASLDGGSGPRNRQYPFVSEPVTVNVKQVNGSVSLTGNKITITVRQRSTGTILQSVAVDFSQIASLPAPQLSSFAGNWTFQSGGPFPSSDYVGDGRLVNNRVVSGVNTSVSVGPNVAGGDVIVSMVAAKNGETLDPRFLAMTGTETQGTLFAPHPTYGSLTSSNLKAQALIGNAFTGLMYNNGTGNTSTLAALPSGQRYPARYQPAPKVPLPATTAQNTGDWDNGVSVLNDGGFLNAADQGNIDASYSTPYYTDHFSLTTNFTSPSRTMPSPGMFGSLPTGFKRGQGWQTLLFRRQPGHPDYAAAAGGFTSDPDYLMLDLFWMPIVEPYAISEPLSTAGKINMNYQIVPFTYLERSTGLYGVLKHEKVISVPSADLSSYKYSTVSITNSTSYRRDLQIPATLTQFQQRFNNSDGTGLFAFRSAAEICDIHFIPDNAGTVNTSSKASLDQAMATYWSTHSLTGDNSREHIYTTVYPRLTTKSNTYTVYFRTQSLKKKPGSDPGTWTEGSDVITGDYRGSTAIERYVDPKNSNIPDYASNPQATPALSTFYHWRQRENRQFAP